VLRWRTKVIEQGLGHYDLENTYADAQKLCEAVCQWIVRTNRVDINVIPDVQHRDPRLNATLLEALMLPALTPQTIRTLANQDTKTVRNVLRGKNQSLKAMLFAALMTTLDVPDHPFRRLSAEALALDRLLRLANLRNDANHASGRDFTVTEVVHDAQFALNWASQFGEWM